MKGRIAGALSVIALLVGGAAVFPTVASAASSTVTITVNSGTGITGATASATATVDADGTSPATGTVTYTLYNGSTCATQDPAYTPATETLGADGSTVPSSPSTAALPAGMYSFEASYSGDTATPTPNDPGTSSCSSFTINTATVTVPTTVQIAGTNVSWTGSEPVSTSAADSASFTGAASGIAPTGSVTYSFFGPSNGACSGTAAATSTETVAGGTIPASASTGPLASGTYSFQATYTSGDANYGSVTDSCQSFSVATASVTVNTLVADAGTGAAWTGTEVTGAQAYDSATLENTVSGFVPGGTVTYNFFANGGCTAPAITSDQVSLGGGAVPNSGNTPALAAGSYSYQASYGGDTNYAPVSSACEPFSVGKATATAASVVYDNATRQPWSGNEATGAGAYDTATLSGTTAAIVPSGSVTYKFFTVTGSNRPCTTAPASQQTVGLGGNGSVPNSNPQLSLARGSYAFEVTYSGDGNYDAPPGVCEPFNVGIGTPSAPVVTDIPGSPTEFGSFVASVSTNGDGQTYVTSNTPSVCTVGSDGYTVSFVLYGTCSLTAFVGVGANYGAAAGAPQLFTIGVAARGYWLVGSDGGIFSFGAARFHGSMGGIPLQRPVVGITPTSDHGGYWLVAADGGVFSFGDTSFYGSIPGLGLHPAGSGLPHSLNASIVGIVPSITQRGYFMVASDGGVFAFGDAHFAGSCPGIGGCVGSAVAVLPDHTGNGYWLVTAEGFVYAFGDAHYYGASQPFGSTAVDAIATPDGKGYWILYANGTVLPFGDASSLGAPLGYVNAYNPATAIMTTADGHGYWVTASRGDVFSYGNASYLGGLAATNLNGPIIAGFGF